MNRKHLVKLLKEKGCYLKRHGSNHDVYYNPENNRHSPIPRHNEIKDNLVKLIYKQLDI